jgi:hypothetical protein
MNDHRTTKPRTEAQKAASRHNGARSSGHVTLTAADHQCLSRHKVGADARMWSRKVLLLEGESRELFREFIAHLESTFLPVTPYELTLVETMAIAK